MARLRCISVPPKLYLHLPTCLYRLVVRTHPLRVKQRFESFYRCMKILHTIEYESRTNTREVDAFDLIGQIVNAPFNVRGSRLYCPGNYSRATETYLYKLAKRCLPRAKKDWPSSLYYMFMTTLPYGPSLYSSNYGWTRTTFNDDTVYGWALNNRENYERILPYIQPVTSKAMDYFRKGKK